MKLETFFEKFDPFADAPGAVAKMRELVLGFSANGAPDTSLGQRPRKTAPPFIPSPEGACQGIAIRGDAICARRGLERPFRA